MEKYIDKKAFVTGLLLIIAAAILAKLFVKKITTKSADGNEVEVIQFGHPSIGHI